MGTTRLSPPDPTTGLFLWQNIFGVWPVDGTVTDELRGRLHGYADKAIREAAVHTTWNDPDAEFEQKVHAWIDELIDGPLATELTSLLAQLDKHARSDSLGQKLIQLTAPGVPDVYQGTELWDDSLVDPDNRQAGELSRSGAQHWTPPSDPKLRVVKRRAAPASRKARRLRRRSLPAAARPGLGLRACGGLPPRDPT